MLYKKLYKLLCRPASSYARTGYVYAHGYVVLLLLAVPYDPCRPIAICQCFLRAMTVVVDCASES